MRSPAFAISLLACLAIAGCSSSKGVEDIMPRPSNEMTSSISRPDSPVPSAEAAGLPQRSGREQEPAAGQQPQPALPAETSALVAPSKPNAAALKAATIYRHRFRDAKPINFGKTSPREMAVHGVDVSRWQGEIDWLKLRSQGANFVYIKATDGGDHIDPMFRKNWNAAARAGLKRGAYHFFYWCRTAGEQADWFIRNVPKIDGALPPVIDVEWNGESSCKRRPSRERVLEKMQVFMDKLERHYGQRPIIYTAPDFYRDRLKGAFTDYPFWLRAVAAHPSKVYPGRKWVFWQYSGSGLTQGLKGRIDLNVFHGSEAAWHTWVSGAEG
jgi:lysozyme